MRFIFMILAVGVLLTCKNRDTSRLSEDKEAAVARLKTALQEVFTEKPNAEVDYAKIALQARAARSEEEFRVFMNTDPTILGMKKNERVELYQGLLAITPQEAQKYAASPDFSGPTTLADDDIDWEMDENKFAIEQAKSPEANNWVMKYILPRYDKSLWTKAALELDLKREIVFKLLNSYKEEFPAADFTGMRSSSGSSLLNFVAALVDAGKLVKPEWITSEIALIANASPAMATYDNEAATIQIKDTKLSHSLAAFSILATKATAQTQQALQGLDPATKKKVLKDTNTLEGASRVEPYDLILNSLKDVVELNFSSVELTGWREVSNKHAAEAAKRAMAVVFSRPNSASSVMALRGISEQEKKFYLACISDGNFKVITRYQRKEDEDEDEDDFTLNGHEAGRIIKSLEFDFTSEDLPEGGLDIECGEKKYHAAFHVTPEKGKLPEPKIDLTSLRDNNVLHVATSVSLISEMSANAIVMGVGYIAAHGFIPYSYKWIPDMKAEFTKEFVNNIDIFIPASHIHDVQGLGVGTGTPLRVDFFKYRSGTPIKLTVYFPSVIYDPQQFAALDLASATWGVPMRLALESVFRQAENFRSKDVVFLKSQEVSDLFCQRRDARRPSAVIFTVACGASETVVDWMAAYRSSLMDADGNIKDLKSFADVPVVVAPNRGFDTNSSIQIMDHLEFPIALIDMIAAGRDMDFVLAELAMNKPRSVIQRIVRGIAWLAPNPEDDERFGSYSFDPTSNKKMKWTLLLGGQLQVDLKQIAN